MSVGWHPGSLLHSFCCILLFVLVVTLRYGISGTTGIVETPGGRALDTPVQKFSRLVLANWHFAAA